MRSARYAAYRRMLRRQRLVGLFLLVVCCVIFAVASKGASIEARDATAVVPLLPAGVYLLLTRKLWMR